MGYIQSVYPATGLLPPLIPIVVRGPHGPQHLPPLKIGILFFLCNLMGLVRQVIPFFQGLSGPRILHTFCLACE